MKERLSLAIGILAAVLLIGTLGYSQLEGWTLFDALYMTVITVGTIGYGETHELHTTGRVFTIFLILGGLGAVGYAFSSVTAFIVEGELKDVLRRRKMLSQIHALKGHYVVCGGGAVGRTIMTELAKTQRPFVAIEKDTDKAAHLKEKGWLVVKGDALTDEVLLEAGIERAKGLFCTLSDDRDNSFVAISARGLSPNVRIVSQLHDEAVREKLHRSGADASVSSGHIGGLRMASEMIRPVAVGFLDYMIRDRKATYRFEDVIVPEGSPLAGQPLSAIKGAEGGAALVVAIRDGGHNEINPAADEKIHAGQNLVVLGTVEQVRALKDKLAA